MKRPALFAILILSLALSVVAGAVAGDLKVLTPADKSIVGSDRVSLVLEVGENVLDEIRVSVNGGEEISITGFSDDRVVCRDGISLSGRLNRIRIAGFRNGRSLVEKRLTVFCRTELTEENHRPPAGFRRVDFHRPEKERICLLCHQMEHDQTVETRSAPGRSPCLTCHEKIGSARFVHGPTAVGSCLMCHEENTKRPKTGGLQAQVKMCGACHEDSLEDWKGQKYGHGPTNLGSCTMCHDPHGSGQPFFLRLNATDLCLACHPDVANTPHVITTSSGKGHPVRGNSNPARPGEAFSCASCHNPHAGQTPLFLNRYDGGSITGFCVSCHDML